MMDDIIRRAATEHLRTRMGAVLREIIDCSDIARALQLEDRRAMLDKIADIYLSTMPTDDLVAGQCRPAARQ